MADIVISAEGTAGGLGSATLTQTAQVNLVYPTFRQALWEGTAGNVLTGTVKAVLASSDEYVYAETDEFLADVPGAGIVAVSPALGGKSITNGVFDANNVRVGAPVSGLAADLCLTFLDSGSAATSRLISHAKGVGYTPVGGYPEIRWSASGVWSLLVPGSGTSVVYPQFVAALLGQTLGDLTGEDFYAVLVDKASYTYSAAHNFLDDVPAGARVATSRVLANVSVVSGTLTADNAEFETVPQYETGDALVVYIAGATDAEHRLVGYSEGFTVTGQGQPLLLAFGAEGVAVLRTWTE